MTLSVLSFGIATGSAVFIVLSAIYAFDAVIGILILKQVFFDLNMVVEFENENSEQAYAPLKDQDGKRRYNNRLPEVVQQSEMGSKMFDAGWKFNQFNEKK